MHRPSISEWHWWLTGIRTIESLWELKEKSIGVEIEERDMDNVCKYEQSQINLQMPM